MTVDPIKYYGFFDFQLDLENQQLLKDGKHVPLTHKAFQVLLLLVKNTGRTTRKAEIFKQLWSDSCVEESNLTQHIHVLRKVLGRTPDGRSYVETVPRLGYRFALSSGEIWVGSDRRKQFWDDELAGPGDAMPPRRSAWELLRSLTFRKTVSYGETPGNRGTTKRAWTRLGLSVLFVMIVMFLILETVATPAFYFVTRGGTQPATAPSAPIRSIAVLPFKPVGGKVDKEKLGFGMTDAVIVNLSKTKQVSVRPTSAVRRYDSIPPVDASSAGRDLNVDVVLEGMVQCDGESLRVSVQLIRVEDGKPMWAESFQEKVSDSFTMQDHISARVADSLSTSLAQPELIAHESSAEAESPASTPVSDE